MSRPRRRFTPEQKAQIVRRHLAGKEAVSALADEFGLQPSQIHTWVNMVLSQAPLEGYLKAFERSFGKNTGKHVSLTMSRIRRIVDGCEFETADDINAESVEEFLLEAKAEDGFGNPRSFAIRDPSAPPGIRTDPSKCAWPTGCK